MSSLVMLVGRFHTRGDAQKLDRSMKKEGEESSKSSKSGSLRLLVIPHMLNVTCMGAGVDRVMRCNQKEVVAR